MAAGKVAEVIGACGCKPDILFLDPARRSDTGRKVFLLEDCSPDILTLKDELLEAAADVLVKLSPMADITMVCSRLGRQVREVHVVEADGECKELLVVMESGKNAGEPEIIVASDGAEMAFRQSEESDAVPDMSVAPAAGMFLFEPGSALMKSGAFNLISSRFGVSKLGRHAHLYCSPNVVPDLSAFGKWFAISEILPLCKASFRELSARSLRAEVTARGLHLTSDELRKKLCKMNRDVRGRFVKSDIPTYEIRTKDGKTYLQVLRPHIFDKEEFEEIAARLQAAWRS